MWLSSEFLAPRIALTKKGTQKGGVTERPSFGLYLSLVWEKSDPVFTVPKSDPVFTVPKVLWVEVKLFM